MKIVRFENITGTEDSLLNRLVDTWSSKYGVKCLRRLVIEPILSITERARCPLDHTTTS